MPHGPRITTSADELVTVRAELSPDPSQIGDLLTLRVTAAYAAGVTVNLPTGLELAPLHLVDARESDPESTGTGMRKVITLTLQHFDTGEAAVPGFPLTYLTPEGEVLAVQVPPVGFSVSSLLANENDPERKPEDPPVSLDYPDTRAELVIYSALVALLVGFLATLLWIRLRRRARPVVLPPPIPPHERALSALGALEGSQLLAEERYQDYYLELTEIAKAYLEGRFGVEALDRTTDEIRRELLRSGDRVEPLHPGELVRFLQGADLVKFARFTPTDDEARGALGEVRDMVEKTRPEDQAATKDTEAGAGDEQAGAGATAEGPARGAAEADKKREEQETKQETKQEGAP